LRSSIGGQVQRIVDQCNHWVLGKKKDPTSYRCSTEIYYPYSVHSESSGVSWQSEQGLHPINQNVWDQAGFPEFFKKKWFNLRKITRSYGTKNVVYYRYYPKIPSHMLEYGYKAAYITEVHPVNGDLESELKFLKDQFARRNGWQIIYGSYRDEWILNMDRTHTLEEIAKQELRKEQQQYEPNSY